MNKELKHIICVLALTVLCLNLKAQIFTADTLHFCKQDSAFLDAGAGYDSYLWNTGETSQSIWAKRSAWYFVEVEIGASTISDSVLLDLNRSRIEQNDTIVCYGADFILSVMNAEPSSLIADYRFDNGDYLPGVHDYKDYSGYGNNARNSNFIEVAKTTDRHGVKDMALYFSPSTTAPASLSCLYIPDNFDMFHISNSFALHCWLNPDTIFGVRSPDNLYYIINKWKPDNADLTECSYALALSNDGHIHFLTSNGTTTQQFATSGDTLIYPGRWAMVDVVCSMNKLKIYVNAELKLNADISVFPQAINALTYLCASSGLQNYNYQGGIDDVKIYSSDISAQEVLNLYNDNTTYSYSYLWSTGDITKEIVINPTEEMDYWVRVSNNIGYCIDSVHIAVYPEFIANITQIRKGCPDTREGVLLINALGGISFTDTITGLPYYKYKWPAGYIYEQSERDSIMYRMAAGEYEIGVLDSVGCINKQMFEVKTYPRLELEIVAKPNKVYPQNPAVHFSTTSACDTCYVYDYLWKFGDGKTSTEAETDYNYGDFDEETITEFVVTHYQTYEANCIDSVTLNLPVARPQLKIPNVFTPNSDGINDTFDITVDGEDDRTLLDVFLSNSIIISNRQGKTVFQQNNYTGKPGEFDGKNLPDGVYFYNLKCKGLKKDESYQGYVHIFRNNPKE